MRALCLIGRKLYTPSRSLVTVDLWKRFVCTAAKQSSVFMLNVVEDSMLNKLLKCPILDKAKGVFLAALL